MLNATSRIDLLRTRLILYKRFIQSFLVLVVFLLLPTMSMRTYYVLLVARLPVWKNFAFFQAMFRIIEDNAKAIRHD